MKYKSPLSPFKILFIETNKIKRTVRPPFYNKIGLMTDVKESDWDKKLTCDFKTKEKYFVWTSLYLRYIKKKEWEKTPLFKKVMIEISKQKNVWYGCDTKEKLLKRLNETDSLYKYIKENGYKTQKELLKLGFLKKKYLPPELNEIKVNITRGGNL